ncbi:MAG: hypothetical protein U0325_14060 [Polyangiales bacterium]
MRGPSADPGERAAQREGQRGVGVGVALRGPEGWVSCWAAVDGDGLTVGAEGED